MIGPVSALTLMPVTSLQSIGLYYTAAQGPAWRLLQQQTCLLSLRVACLEYSSEGGIKDTFLRKVADLHTLVELDLHLSSLATDDGIRSLSQMTNLQSLRLPVCKHEARISGSSVTVFTNLTQLTCLSLTGWPITAVDIISLTCLSNLQNIDFSDCQRLSCLSFMPLLQFPCLHTLNIVRGDEWTSDAIVRMFELLRPAVALTL